MAEQLPSLTEIKARLWDLHETALRIESESERLQKILRRAEAMAAKSSQPVQPITPSPAPEIPEVGGA